MALNTISSVYERLQKEQPAMRVSLVNTRVMLQTGVNLRSATAEQNADPAVVAKVMSVLRDMGVAA